MNLLMKEGDAIFSSTSASPLLDHKKLMVLALQLYDVYRESIFGFASKKWLAGERIDLVYSTLVST